MAETLTLEGWGGEGCWVDIVKRDKPDLPGCDPVFVMFKSKKGHGPPSLELAEVQVLLKRMEAMGS